MEKLMSFFEGFDIEKLGEMLPSVETLMDKLPGWAAWLVLAGPLLMLGLGAYYLFAPPKEANHAMGYRFFYAMSRVEVWQHAQYLAGIVYMVLGGVLFFILGLICMSFSALPAPDMVWRAVKCLIWEVVLIIIATLAVDILIVLMYDHKGEPRKTSASLRKTTARRSTVSPSRRAAPAQRPRRRPPL